MLSIRLLLLLLLYVTARVAAAGMTYADGAQLPYVPSLIGDGGAAGAMAFICIISSIYIFFSGPLKRNLWALILPFGSLLMALGGFGRIWLRDHQTNVLVYDVSSLLITCLPVSFLAFNYMIYGRFITALEGHEDSKDITVASKYSAISSSNIKTIFITSDLVTLFIVTTGTGLQLSQYKDLAEQGANIFLFGTSLQALSYSIFSVLVLTAHWRLFRQDRRRFQPLNLKEPCVQLFLLLYISGTGIMVRSGYRLTEAILGVHSSLTYHEIYYLTLDAAPLCVSAGVWIIVWPGYILRRIKSMAPAVVLENSLCEVMQPAVSLDTIVSFEKSKSHDSYY